MSALPPESRHSPASSACPFWAMCGRTRALAGGHQSYLKVEDTCYRMWKTSAGRPQEISIHIHMLTRRFAQPSPSKYGFDLTSRRGAVGNACGSWGVTAVPVPKFWPRKQTSLTRWGTHRWGGVFVLAIKPPRISQTSYARSAHSIGEAGDGAFKRGER